MTHHHVRCCKEATDTPHHHHHHDHRHDAFRERLLAREDCEALRRCDEENEEGIVEWARAVWPHVHGIESVRILPPRLGEPMELGLRVYLKVYGKEVVQRWLDGGIDGLLLSVIDFLR